ncbi:hypothetical protein NPIL_323981 [Nephila pilipes]|uniref:Uncharacterized protein n=1 Tax=Nephila pilipes TaxID=299642 RepID=A0A8X6PMY7_NEPPI|nr:hypothetical protein NPIL_323981 [Nephila pilipes]
MENDASESYTLLIPSSSKYESDIEYLSLLFQKVLRQFRILSEVCKNLHTCYKTVVKVRSIFRKGDFSLTEEFDSGRLQAFRELIEGIENCNKTLIESFNVCIDSINSFLVCTSHISQESEAERMFLYGIEIRVIELSIRADEVTLTGIMALKHYATHLNVIKTIFTSI